MAITTYAELKTAINSYLDRDDYDVDTLIDLAEARHKTDIRVRDMITISTTSTSARRVSLPAGFLEMIYIRLKTDPVTILDELNIHEMSRKRRETTGKPEYYTIHSDIEFDVTPDDSYTLEMVYYKSFTPLSSTSTTNALLTRSPGAYLYAALIEAEPFGFNDERLPLWNGMYNETRDRLNEMDKNRAGPLISRVVGDTP